MVLEEKIDTLINSRRYDIMNEGFFGKKEKSKESKSHERGLGVRIDGVEVVGEPMYIEPDALRKGAKALNEGFSNGVLKMWIMKYIIARLSYNAFKRNDVFTKEQAEKINDNFKLVSGKYGTTYGELIKILKKPSKIRCTSGDKYTSFLFTIETNPAFLNNLEYDVLFEITNDGTGFRAQSGSNSPVYIFNVVDKNTGKVIC